MSLIAFLLNLHASAATLPHFKEGRYRLTEGQVDRCNDGPFEYLRGRTYVGFGAYHLFSLENKTQKLTTNLPEYNGCVYEAVNKRASAETASTLSFEETLRCPTGVRHVLRKTAVVQPDRVTVDVVQKGNPDFGDEEPDYEFRCVWQRDAAPPKKR